MDRPRKGKEGEDERSPEYEAFEALVKQVMSVSKEEIDRREETERRARE